MSQSDSPANSTDITSAITTNHARTKLTKILHNALSQGTNTLIDAPTSLGKTHTVATTPWSDYPNLTGNQPMVHFHGTTDTRREAAQKSDEAGIKYAEVQSGLEICPVARGEFDGKVRSVDGKEPSEWLKHCVNARGFEFHAAHRLLENKLGSLPCQGCDGGCPSKNRWNGLLRDDSGDPVYDIIHTTHEFAHVPRLVEDVNVIFDEQPSFNSEVWGTLQESLLQNAVNAHLKEKERSMSWSNLIEAVCTQNNARLRAYREFFSDETSGWNNDKQQSRHNHTRAVAEALTNAKPTLTNKRYFGESGETRVVLDEQGTLRQVHQPPALSEARCVIGLDAFPSKLLWQLNTVEDLCLQQVLTAEDRKRWRIEQRGLYVIQVGEHVRSYTRGWRGDVAIEKAETIIAELTREYGSMLRTSISSKAIERDVQRMLSDADINAPIQTMHFGDLKSRNNFDGEKVGLVIGCNDPGDDRILDQLALCGLSALPELDENGERDYGREFVGPDADAAAEFLASVRENNLAQAVGRYARNPVDEESGATVYVWSSALPDTLTDDTVPGVISRVTDLKDEIQQYVRREKVVTKKQVAETVDTAGSHAYEVLQELLDQGIVTVSKGTGYYGADEYQYVSGKITRSVDLGF